MKKKSNLFPCCVTLYAYIILFNPLRHLQENPKTLVKSHKKSLLEYKDGREYYSFAVFPYRETIKGNLVFE